MPQDTASYLLPPRRLPITDRTALRAALAEADVPTMLMVLTHHQRDEAFAQRFAPYLGSPYNHRLPPLPGELVQELRDRLFAVLTQDTPPDNTPLPRELMRKMMSINVGEPVTDEFIPLLIEQMGFDKVSPRLKDPRRQAPPADYKVLVIGAGLTGLLAGIKLEEAGYGYQIFEKNPEIGGTWFENVYPGVGVDTPSHFYCYSFEPNPDWTYFHPRGAEMQAYLLRIADKYRLRRNIVFNTVVEACVYDDTRKKWRVTVKDKAGERVVEADAIINAQGPLNRWSMPNIPGLGDFKGIVMHTARWNRDIDLKGKRVALIGTGASAAQVGPAIVDQVEHLTVFQRSKHWVMPNPVFDQKVPEGVKWALRHIPRYAEWFRFRIYWFSSDGLFKNVQIDPEWPHQDRSISAHNEAIRQYCVGYLQKQCEERPDLLEKLTPDSGLQQAHRTRPQLDWDYEARQCDARNHAYRTRHRRRDRDARWPLGAGGCDHLRDRIRDRAHARASEGDRTRRTQPQPGMERGRSASLYGSHDTWLSELLHDHRPQQRAQPRRRPEPDLRDADKLRHRMSRLHARTQRPRDRSDATGVRGLQRQGGPGFEGIGLEPSQGPQLLSQQQGPRVSVQSLPPGRLLEDDAAPRTQRLPG